MKLPQLLMILPDTSPLPPLSLPLGFALHNHTVGKDESAWERIVEAAFGSHYGFDSFLVAAGGYAPENVLYISRNGTDIATTTAVENDRYPGFGWLRWQPTLPHRVIMQEDLPYLPPFRISLLGDTGRFCFPPTTNACLPSLFIVRLDLNLIIRTKAMPHAGRL